MDELIGGRGSILRISWTGFVVLMVALGCSESTAPPPDAGPSTTSSGAAGSGGSADAGPDAGGTGGCPGWQDDTTELCWENPPLAGPLYWDDAQDYCTELGAEWRLPTVDELRSLISAGSGLGDCANNEATGACGVTDPSCLTESPCHDGCGACVAGDGPDDDPAGCFWIPALSGTCEWYWASSLLDGSATEAWYVAFPSGQIFFEDGTVYDNEVRCVLIPLTLGGAARAASCGVGGGASAAVDVGSSPTLEPRRPAACEVQ